MATYGILCIHCGVNSATPSGALPCSYHSGGHRFFFPTDGPQVVVPETVAAPVERALMAGDSRTGVTIHRTTAELDAGPIAAQEAFDVDPEDDAGAVFDRSAEIAARLLDGVIAEPQFDPQPADGVTYAEKITPEDRELDLLQPARELVNHIRALSPHIGARAVIDGRPVLVWKAHVGDDGGLELLEVQPEGGRRMAYAEYRRGLR